MIDLVNKFYWGGGTTSLKSVEACCASFLMGVTWFDVNSSVGHGSRRHLAHQFGDFLFIFWLLDAFLTA
jgi:hypothetical protein